jgi:acyl-CoA hydrolase
MVEPDTEQDLRAKRQQDVNRRRSRTMRRRLREGGSTGRATSLLSDLEMAGMLHGGATLEEIGQAAGLTRERVRQRLKRIGVTAASRLDVMKLVTAIRQKPIISLYQAGESVGAEALAVERALYELGLIDSVVRLFRLRKHARRSEQTAQTVEAIRRYAAQLGRTPSRADILRKDRPPGVPSLTSLQKQFGSLSAAMLAAKLVPNVRGRRSS